MTADALMLVDTFDDGSITDGVPVTWLPGVPPFSGGVRDATSGDLVMSFPSGGVGATVVAGHTIADISITTRVRASNSDFDSIGAFARSSERTSYFAGILADGRIGIGISDELGGTSFLELIGTSLDPVNNDVLLKFDVVDDALSLTAWEPGATAPASPQLTLNDTRYAAGGFGVFANLNSATATFRFFEAIPEPSAVALAAVAITAMLAWRQRQ